MALQRMGVVPDYARIRACSVAIVGVGGVGAVAAEMLTRCGVGRLLLFDCDTVEPANMNRLFFVPSQCGMTKVDAACATLRAINPDVRVEGHCLDVTTLAGCAAFKTALCDGGGGGGEGGGGSGGGGEAPPPPACGGGGGGGGEAPPPPASATTLILSCVDNYAARMTVNAVALELDAPWMESGVSEDAVSGHVQVLEPGRTACFACLPPLCVAAGIDEGMLRREGVCAASLPTTMGIVAGLLVQAALKRMLGFGRVSCYLGYSSLTDHFPTLDLKPNPTCTAPACVAAQARVRQEDAARPKPVVKEGVDDAAAAVVHEDNDWGIEVEAGGEEGAGGGGAAAAPPPPPPPPPSAPRQTVEELMAQLERL
jgi:ubiquitin-like modifier-activating enzyme 5